VQIFFPLAARANAHLPESSIRQRQNTVAKVKICVMLKKEGQREVSVIAHRRQWVQAVYCALDVCELMM
jgi:hypothetical protein